MSAENNNNWQTIRKVAPSTIRRRRKISLPDDVFSINRLANTRQPDR
jgi:hypothetical protein